MNNPHASALHCGACGGYSGEVNARLLAALLNDRDVRRQLAGRAIVIPDDTLFVGALHDTTTDAVTIYAQDHDTASHGADLREATNWFESAGSLTRTERALRLPHATGEHRIRRRSRDWSEVRPEWALAGCQAIDRGASPPHGRSQFAGPGISGTITTGRRMQGSAFSNSS